MNIVLMILAIYGGLSLLAFIVAAIIIAVNENCLSDLLIATFLNVFFFGAALFVKVVDVAYKRKLKKLYGKDWNRVSKIRTIVKKPTRAWHGVPFMDKLTFVLGRKPYTFEELNAILEREKQNKSIK